MRKSNRPSMFALVVGLVLTCAYFISAQEDTRPDRSSRQQRERGQRGEGGRRQFDPAQIIERQVQRPIQDLNLTAEEKAILEPRIQAIAHNRMQQRQEMQSLTEGLQAAVDGKNEAQIKSALSALKAKRKVQQEKSEALEKELVELLTLRQEAQLTIAGIVNSDGGLGGFGGRGGRFGGRREGRRGGGQ